MTPLWLVLVQALGIILIASALMFVLVGGAFACVMLFFGFGVPRIYHWLERCIEPGERACAWLSRYRYSIVGSIVVALCALSMASWQWYFYWDTSDIPDAHELVVYTPPQVGFVYDQHGSTMIELAKVFRRPMEYERVPLVMEHATIAFEDRSFYSHDGVDWLALPIRLMTDKGGSTITMQLARNHYLSELMSRERGDELLISNWATRLGKHFFGAPWVNKRIRKIREIKYALHLERQLRTHARAIIDERMRSAGFWWPQRWWQSRIDAKHLAKQMILARYLTTRYYGYSTYDPESAARFFFNEPADALTADQAALLASFAPAPSRYAVIAESADVKRQQRDRRDYVLDAMGTSGFLLTAYDCGTSKELWDQLRWTFRTDLPRGDCIDEVSRFKTRPVDLLGTFSGGRTDAPASVQTALDELEIRGFSDRLLLDGSVRIHTTTDMILQRAVNRAASVGVETYRHHYPDETRTPQVAIIVLRNADGAILAQYGGIPSTPVNSWTHLDRSRKSWRQPGSAFKVFVYLAAFVMKPDLTPDSYINDDFYSVRMGGGWYKSISNYDGLGKGLIPLRESMAQSRNVPAMKIGMNWAGLDAIITTAYDAGITTPLKHEPSIILGSNDLSLIEMANGFRAIASGGIRATPYIIDHVTNSLGSQLFQHRPDVSSMSVSSDAIQKVRELLRGNVRLPSGTAHSLASALPDVPLLCKTGTSNDYADARAVCSTWGPTGITVHAWMGWDDSRRPLGDRATGGRLALPMVRTVFGATYHGDAPITPPEIESRLDAYIEKHYPTLVQK